MDEYEQQVKRMELDVLRLLVSQLPHDEKIYRCNDLIEKLTYVHKSVAKSRQVFAKNKESLDPENPEVIARYGLTGG